MFDWMHLTLLGVGRSVVPSTLKLLKLLNFHYEEGESDALFLKRASIEMRASCKQRRLFDSSPNMFCKRCFWVYIVFQTVERAPATVCCPGSTHRSGLSP